MKTKDIKDLISNNRMEDALEQIIELTNSISDGLHNDACLLKNRWVNFEKKTIGGLANDDPERNRIVSASLHLVDELKAQFKSEPGLDPQSNITLKADYYKFYGLRGLRDSTLIQDFNVSREGGTHNINPIQFLWADSLFGNTITAKIIGDRKTLRIQFDNFGGWGCNIAIRCQDGVACHNKNRSKYLSFDARIPLEEIRGKKESIRSKLLNEVGISARIVNGRLQHWEYAHNPKEYIIKSVKASDLEGKSVKIDLSDESFWHLFTSDGNIVDDHQGPDFSIIASVILGFGSVSKSSNEPESGSGIIDIRAIKLTDN
jgi:hypothetical protein